MTDTTPPKKTEAKAAAPAPTPAPLRALQVNRWRQGDFTFQRHDVLVETSVPYEHLFDSRFWANVALKLHPNDSISVYPDDGTYHAELIVRNAGRNWAVVEEKYPRKMFERSAMPPEDAEQFRVEFAGAIDKWRVLRIADQAVIKTGFPSKLDADIWLNRTYLRSLAA